MKSFVLTLMLVLFGASAQSKETINLLLLSAPGGIYDTQLRALEKTLKDSGHVINYVLANSCKGAAVWIKSNPNAAVIFQTSAEEEINRINNPESDSACDIGFNKSSLIATGLITNMNVCTMHPIDQAMQRLLKSKNVMGTTFIPPTNGYLVEGLIETLKLDSKLIRYQGNVKLVQALVSRDIDFAIFGNIAPALAAGATCFLTTAPPSRARHFNMTSLATISPGNPWIDNRQVYVYMGRNIDFDKMRSLTVRTLKEDENIQKQIKVGYQVGGIASGQTLDQQWLFIENHIRSMTKGK